MMVKFLDELALRRDRGNNVGLRNGGVNLVLWSISPRLRVTRLVLADIVILIKATTISARIRVVLSRRLGQTSEEEGVLVHVILRG